MKDENKIIIFDTTLRDGEQSPGASMNTKEKIELALALERLGVDVMEAGFAAASPGDFDAVKQIAQTITKVRVASLSRCIENDIYKAGEAVKPAKLSRIHTFIATSPIHMEYKLKKSPAEVLKIASHHVAYAKSLCEDVEFSCEDALRSDPGFLKEMADAVYEAGARTLNIPDTVGYCMPEEIYELIKDLKTHVKDRMIISLHNHNDLGLATANTLAGVLGGARQVEVTINGIGERAGNAALEEFVMVLKTRADFFKGLYTDINTKEIYPSSQLLSSITGLSPQVNKAIVGRNAFAHESGIHQDGILKHRETYEIMRAQDVGIPQNTLVLGKHSGRAAFSDKLKELGFEDLAKEELDGAFARFKELCDLKKEVSDADIRALLIDSKINVEEKYHLQELFYQSKNHEPVQAKITLRRALCQTDANDASVELCEGFAHVRGEASHPGTIDAIFKAIEAASGVEGHLNDYKVDAITSGKDSLARVSVKVKFDENRPYLGHGLDTDTVQASARAYVSALNAYLNAKAGAK